MAGKRRSWTSMTTIAVCCRDRLMGWGVRPSFMETSKTSSEERPILSHSGTGSICFARSTQPSPRLRLRVARLARALPQCPRRRRSRAAVEAAVLDGLGDVLGGDVIHAREVGDGAGHLEDA